MEKLIYLVWAKEGWDPDETQKTLLDECAPHLIELGAKRLSMNINDSDADVPSPVPTPEGEQPLAAEVCLWLDCLDRRRPFEEVLEGVGLPMAGYLVTESLYTDYGGNQRSKPRDWPDGQRSPGVLTVAVFDKPERFTYEEWYDHWYGTQSPMSEEMQPRTRYVRNAVVRPITPNAPPIKGIVDEAWPSAEHITNPMLFYGAGDSQEKLMENLKTMLESVSGFLDIDNIRNVTMSEYLLKS
jgi:hypothetical protein